jgi:CrcB protein
VIHLSPPVLVGVGGAVGALLRYVTTAVLDAESFPFGTLAVNVVGSFVLGLLTFSGAGGDVLLLAGVGACGSYTTFSSFAYDTVRLVESGHPRRGAANAFGTFLAAIAGVGLAWLLVG